MRRLLALSAAVVLSSLFTATAKADTDFEDIQQHAYRAYQYAGQLRVQAGNLPSNFPGRASYLYRIDRLRTYTGQIMFHAQRMALGHGTETNRRALRVLIPRAKNLANWLEDRFDHLEDEYGGDLDNLLRDMRESADEAGDSLRRAHREWD